MARRRGHRSLDEAATALCERETVEVDAYASTTAPERDGHQRDHEGERDEDRCGALCGPRGGRRAGAVMAVFDEAAADPPSRAPDLKCQKSQASDLIQLPRSRAVEMLDLLSLEQGQQSIAISLGARS
jgi:hypothetical protein